MKSTWIMRRPRGSKKESAWQEDTLVLASAGPEGVEDALRELREADERARKRGYASNKGKGFEFKVNEGSV